MLNNKTFYPTPRKLIDRMLAKVKGHPHKVLEPSAGKGDIIARMDTSPSGFYSERGKFQGADICAIEIDPELQATLTGKGIKLIDTDFLTFSGPDKFDLIIANPPFDEGDRHLLKAIDIMYRGEIVFLLNAETLRNPYTNTRRELVKRLDELGADVEYIAGAFVDAERPTGVEIALVYINIERQVEDDLFTGVDDEAGAATETVEELNELVDRNHVKALVISYNDIVNIGTRTIADYYRHYNKVGKYITLNEKPSEYVRQDWTPGDLTALMQGQLNDMLRTVRVDYWRRTLDLPEVKSRLTAKKRDEFEHMLTERSRMDFTENNIRQFILNLLGGFEKTLMDAVLDIFDKFTIEHHYSDGRTEYKNENIHYFNGWKTNKAFKVGKKVIIPLHGSYGGAFRDWSGRGWSLDCDAERKLHDIDIVMNYFDGMVPHYNGMGARIRRAFEAGQSANIRSTYFTITCYKKGTIHLTFNDPDILRRFNLAACRGKGWLPVDYGQKAYSDMGPEEKEVVNEFEGAFSYTENMGRPMFDVPQSNFLQLTEV